MKKLILTMLFIGIFLLTGCSNKLKPLPKPENESGIRGELFGIDKNINEKTLDEYLNRNDIIYRDMRMFIDPANYENIGGDSYLSGFVEGFEIVPIPYIIPLSNLPEEIGKPYEGETLFSISPDGEYIANFKESLIIIEFLFPKDKVIFLMCGGGGYAGLMKQFLIDLGWNQDIIYNVGGHWYYEGNHNIQVKRINENSEVIYDFWKAPYHKIDLELLTRV